MSRILEARARIRPLAAQRNIVLAVDGLTLLLTDKHLHDTRPLVALPASAAKRVGARSRLLRRLLRTEPTDGIFLDETTALVNHRSQIWHVDITSGSVNLDFTIPHERRAMRLSQVKGVSGFADGVYFGDYMNNPSMASATVWARPDDSQRWEPAFTFPDGEINHIHDVVADPYRNCVWVLTGDFNNGAAIWRAEYGWGQVEPVLRGDQRFRAAWMWVTPKDIYYATDSQLEPNSLVRLKAEPNGWGVESLVELPGSSIYGVASGDRFYFSTAVEPGLPPQSRLRSLLERKPGPGIRDEYSCVYLLNSDGSAEELVRGRKDHWPMRPFQFGTFRLCPSAEGVYANGVGLVGLDGVTLTLTS